MALGHRRSHHSPCRLCLGQTIRKRIEEGFGWIKTIAGRRKARFEGRDRFGWAFDFAAAAYNLIHLPKLLEART